MGAICTTPRNPLEKEEFERKSRRTTQKGKKAEVKSILKIVHCEVLICVGDICEEDAMAIVHPTDKHLMNNSEYSQHVIGRAGLRVKTEIEDYRLRNKFKLTGGHIFVTHGGGLRASKIIHIIPPAYKTGETNELINLEKAIFTLLSFADKSNFSSVSCPIIGMIQGDYPLKDSLAVSFRAFYRYFFAHKESCIRQIRLVTSDEKTGEEMVHEGWNLHNEEEFAATKSDFGSVYVPVQPKNEEKKESNFDHDESMGESI